MNEIKGLEYTEYGYIVSNGQYIGLKDDNEWEWYGNIDLARKKLKPVININVIEDIRDYINFISKGE